MTDLLEELRTIEFDRIRYDEESEAYFGIQKGNIPFLISAPHGARHFRNHKWKEEDEYTSSIAIKLGEATGAHVIYVKNRTREDPNYDGNSKYKAEVKNIINHHGIKFLLDIHGASPKRPFKVCVGTRYIKREKSSCPTFKDVIEEVLREFQGPPIFNRKNFKARKPETITSFARMECGIEAAQIEINARYRIVERKPDSTKALSGKEPFFRADPKDVLMLFDTLKKTVRKIAEKIKTPSSVPDT